MVRLGGGSVEAIRAAGAYRCDICRRHARAQPRAPARPPRATRFNELVAIDVFVIQDLNGATHACLIVVDLASHYTVARVILEANHHNPSAKAATSALDASWLHWAGAPQKLLFDQGSHFRGTLREMCNELGIEHELTATEAHWQNGMAERRIEHVKYMADRVFEQNEVIGADAVNIALSAISGAINRLSNREGFSPTQWVLGYNIRLPGSLMDERTSVTENEEARAVGGAFWRRLKLREDAAGAFHKVDNEERLRRALAAGVRPVTAEFRQGQLVHYFRTRGLIGNRLNRWHGPARIIGQDGGNFWLIHNRIPILPPRA